LGAVVLDVWEDEPNIDIELLRMVDLSTAHIAGYSLEGKIGGMIMIYEAACEYFRIESKYGIEDFLPEPEVKQIEVDAKSGSEQEVLHETVQKVYAINRDDFNTREIAMVPEESRGKFFDDLRRDYPVRREFQNTEVVLKTASESFAKKVRCIGFKVSDARK
jgi:erythronate-4-phosphate dehydrogenase